MTAQLVVAIPRLANLGDDAKAKDLLAESYKTLAKHGVTKEAVEKFQLTKESDPKEFEKATKALAALVKDKPAFTGDIMKLLEKLSANGVKQETSELKDLKITGDKAKGNAVSKINGTEVSQPIDFVKIGGSWHMVVPDTRAKTDKNPKPQPIDKK